jgi:hypothetical protein
MVDLLHPARDPADGGDRFAGGALNRRDLSRDLLRGLGGLHCQRFDFGRDHGKTLPGLSGARCFDRGVQGKEVGLFGDIADQVDDVADLLRCLRQAGDLAIGRLRLAVGQANDFGSLGELAADLPDQSQELFGRGRRGVDVRRCLAGGVPGVMSPRRSCCEGFG